MAVLSAVALAVADAVVDVALDLVGFWAPHGWSSRQAAEHVLFCPHAVTHWLPHSRQTK